MTHNERIRILASLGWSHDDESGRHKIYAERCVWISGKISCVDWSAWMSEVSGMVYLHASPAVDLPFEEFVGVVRNGWPEKKQAPAERSLFGDDE